MGDIQMTMDDSSLTDIEPMDDSSLTDIEPMEGLVTTHDKPPADGASPMEGVVETPPEDGTTPMDDVRTHNNPSFNSSQMQDNSRLQSSSPLNSSPPGSDISSEDDTTTFDFNWDDFLLSIQWETVSWRRYTALFERVPWEQLHDWTLNRLTELHRKWNTDHPDEVDGVISPAISEWYRRDIDVKIAMDENRDPRDWITNVRSRSPTPVEETSLALAYLDLNDGWIYKDARPGFITVGFELEFPVALHATGDALPIVDPHPNAGRFALEYNKQIPQSTVRNTAVARALELLNGMEGDMMFFPRDPDEYSQREEYELKVQNLHRMDKGLPKRIQAPKGSPDSSPPKTEAPLKPEVEKVAQDGLRTAMKDHFSPQKGGQSIAFASGGYIRSIAESANVASLGLERERTQATNRILDLLNLEAFRAQQDRRHVPLSYMKPRYRAFSVYASGKNAFVYRRGYADEPEGTRRSLLQKAYAYEILKVASPVMRMSYPPKEIEDSIESIFQTMRKNFRIHREMPSLGATTQITVSHSAGFTLLDIKRLASLVYVLGPTLRWLNQEHRTQGAYTRICGSLGKVSMLAKLSQTDPDVTDFDPDNIMPNARNPEERQAQLEEMNRHLPSSILSRTNQLKDNVFFTTLWRYTNINDIVAAVTPGWPGERADVMIKCSGPGQETGRHELSGSQANGADKEDDALDFSRVDAERGVIEFRSCGLTLDSAHVACWMIICEHIVSAAKSWTPAEFKHLITQIVTDQSPFEALGIPARVQKYYKELLNGSYYLEKTIDEVSWNNPFY
ncbi:hypothetical protein F5Y13DRAFT_205767 [Hypoxylon sp. FL1857]|nr:hypothetical protein F5Y13DRAFT_205767 [Hypoxylon sp. FL1857]